MTHWGLKLFFAPNEEIEIIDFEGEELGVQQYRARSVNGNLEQTITESHISSCWPPKFITIEGKTYERKD